MLRTTPRVLLFVLLVFAVICAPRLVARLGAWARDSEGSASVAAGAPLDEHPALAAAGLPVDLELVVIVEDLASLRRTAEGRAMAALLGEAGVTEPLDKSWEVLAHRLGLTPGEAVDRLLGRRVVLAIRDGAGGGGGDRRAGARRWTLISEIDDETAEVLRTKLDVSPRTVVKGQQVYAVEGGNLDLALHWRGADRVTLLLGPSDAPDLLNDLIVAAITPLPEGETMTRSPVLDESRRLGPADVVVLGRVDPPADEERADAPHWDNFVVLNLRREPGAGGGSGAQAAGSSLGGFSARIILRDASAWDGLAGVGAWSDGPVRAAGDAMAAVVEATPARTPAPDSAGPLGAILSALAPPTEISGRATGRRAMFILPRKEAGEGLGFEGAAGAGGVRLAVAAELTDLAGAAPAIDELIAERIGDAERLLGSGAPSPTIAAGLPLRAARVEPMRLPEGNAVEAIVGGRPVVAWTYRPAPGMVRGGEKDARDGGWCVLTLSAADGSAAATAQHVADLLTAGGAEGKGRRWLSVGHLSPSEILAPVHELSWLKRVRGIAEHVGRIEWRLEVTDLLDVEGEASVRLAEPKGR